MVVVYDMDDVKRIGRAMYSHPLLHTWDQSGKLHVYRDGEREEAD